MMPRRPATSQRRQRSNMALPARGAEMKKSHSVPLTRESYEALQEELKRSIREERPKVIQAIAEARGHGDLSENAEYDAAKNRQGFIEGKIQELKDKLARAYVV